MKTDHNRFIDRVTDELVKRGVADLRKECHDDYSLVQIGDLVQLEMDDTGMAISCEMNDIVEGPWSVQTAADKLQAAYKLFQ